MRSDSRNEKCLLPQRGAYVTCRRAGKIAGKYTDVPLSKQNSDGATDRLLLSGLSESELFQSTLASVFFLEMHTGRKPWASWPPYFWLISVLEHVCFIS